MEVITPKQQQRRLDELQAPDIERLIKEAHRLGKGSWPVYILSERYGIEGDFDLSGKDWGEPPMEEQQ